VDRDHRPHVLLDLLLLEGEPGHERHVEPALDTSGRSGGMEPLFRVIGS
jgi:hypothetical protein